jgi:hypothetical protein
MKLMQEQDRLCQQLRITETLLYKKVDRPYVSKDHKTALMDRIWANHERASHMQARSVEGSLFQIQLAYADMTSLAEIAKVSESLRAERERRASRLLYSAAEYLQRLAPVMAYSDCRQAFMPSWQNVGGRLKQAMEYTWDDAHDKEADAS